MTTLSLGQAAGLTGRGKTILARAISGQFFTGSKEDGGHNMDGAESARVYPFPAPVETVAELRTRLALAEERLSELKAMLRTSDVTAMLGANKRRRACCRHLRQRCHGGGGCVRPDERDPCSRRQLLFDIGIGRWIEGALKP